MTLRLRPYGEADEAQATAIHEQMRPDNFTFLLHWEPSMSWSAFLQSDADQRRGLDPSTYRVRGCQLAAAVGDDIVGRASLRFELNEFFAQKGGHVGYGVAPAHRRQGYATEILRESLIILRAEGIEHVLVTCDDNNLGSARVIEHNGGVLESVVPFEVDGKNVGLRRYWID
jgi:predicted acetyltransferase